ncbi:hypothetical protein BJL95_04500 [Methylomonas sp. LWB]|uniref:helix-turn-helix domain-containing protein n=1 Tax=Methylomonas sp. LWB TaxID=1905845 RepID=UPI0008DA9B1B|nr:helix-turn-helix transcriptional regulator [Methylomonas sp. LWB]OHX37838.1 hypothetical protein BJL95_04500 [Methylomonas sp. LWB]
MTNPKIIYTNKTEIAVLKAVGARLREAREALRMRQFHAANLIETSVQAVIDAEEGRLNPLPIKFLKAAAETYAVSVDWLLGLIEWEKEDAGRDLLAGLQRIHLKHYSTLVARQADADEINHRAQVALAEIVMAFEAFQKANAGFIDMPAGARLLRAVSAARKIKVAHPIGNKQTLNV